MKDTPTTTRLPEDPAFPRQAAGPPPAPTTGSIAVVSTVHNGQDTRVLRRTTIALADAGNDVFYVTTDPPPPAALAGHDVTVAAIDRPTGRFDRMTRIQGQALRATLATGADVVHIHDPELLPTALVLRAMGRTVVFDLHEDVAAQVLLKEWIPSALRPTVRAMVAAVEIVLPQLVDEVVVADPDLANRLLDRGATNVTLVENHPDLSEMPTAAPGPRHPRQVVYVGGVTPARGLFTMIDALRMSTDRPFRLVVGGPFPSAEVEAEAHRRAAGLDVDFLGWLPRTGVWELLLSSAVGLAVLDRTPNYERAQPTKVYEYLAAGLDVIASDFPLWRRLFVDVDQVTFVEPGDAAALAHSIQQRLDHPSDAATRASLREHVATTWSWSRQRAALLDVHARLRRRRAELGHS